MIELCRLSSKYDVRRLEEPDVEEILELCRQHTLFYEHTEARPERERILDDMRATPPGISPEDKYYFGFFKDRELIAVMDLIDGYPRPETAYIGFFMMSRPHQGRQFGSEIIREVTEYLRSAGKTAIRLAIDKGNPQSTHFWKKNGFEVIAEKDVNGWTKLVAEKRI